MTSAGKPKSTAHDEKHEKFRALLDEFHQWPCNYLFKFVAPIDQEPAIRKLFPNYPVEIKHSAQGNYVSVSVSVYAESPDLIIAIYEHAANNIKGLISL